MLSLVEFEVDDETETRAPEILEGPRASTSSCCTTGWKSEEKLGRCAPRKEKIPFNGRLD